jgi:endonuclease YncB( thermonuclease family)
MVNNILKWGCGTLLVLIAFIVIVGIAGAILLPDPDKRQSPNAPHEEVLNPKEEPVRTSEPKEEPKSAEVEADARAYYDAAARGDYDYTYEHLTEMDRMSFSREDWTTANQNLQSDQATYEITDIQKADLGGYDVELTVNDEPRTTRFVSESGTFKHELTGKEFTMFTDALYGVSASASASASASPEPSGGNTVTVVDVVDGDTFDIDPVVQGMDRVRLIGVDTPEVFGGEEPCDQEASDFTTSELDGQQVRLELGEDPEDPYGRLLAYAFVGNEFFNETLVAEGLADARSYPPNTKYDAQLEAAEATAKTPVCGGDASASASASASPNPSGDANSKLNNGLDDVNCSDLPGRVWVGSNNEDGLDSDDDGWGCE